MCCILLCWWWFCGVLCPSSACFLDLESTGHHFIADGLNPRLRRIVPRKWAEITGWDDCLNNSLLEEHSLCALWSSDEEGSRMLLLHSSTLKNISTSFSVTRTDFAGHPNVLLPPVRWLMWSISDYTVFFFPSGAKIGLALWLVTEELLAFPGMTHLSPCWYIWNYFELCGAW